MARKPSEPSPKSTGSKTVDDDRPAEQRALAGVRTQIAGEHAEPTETAGPVAIARLRKADGRALILYSAAGDRA